MLQMDSLVDSIRGSDVLSLGGDDSNTIIMPEKNNKKKRKNQVNEKLKENKTPKLSKSQKRKMKKLEEEKEKALLLSKSIETLQKYKIQEDVYALMRSSRNLGQVETAREKRGRAVQFSKIGLEIPYSIRPSKRKAVVDSSEEVELASSNNEANHGSEEDDSTQLVRAETEISSVSAFSSNCSQEFVPSKEAASENSDKSVLEDAIRPMSSNSCTGGKSANSMDGIDDDTKVSHDSTGDLGSSHSHRIPTIVHVSRPNDVEDKRKDLPIVMMEQEIMEAINENSSVIVCGETGCGKTTQVPQFLYEAGFGSSQSVDRTGIIGVTQPRRVAVLATAKRVAFELGVRLGREVGFQVRHDKRIGDNCSIKFMTDGILLREVQSDFLLRRYSIIILDEAHERSLNTDILIGMLSRVIRLRQSVYENQQKAVLSGEKVSPENKIYPLRLVLMSATLRVEDFVSGRRIFRNPPPIIEVPTRQYPVTIHFSKKTEIVDYVGQAYKKALSIHKRLPPGGILIFVTGQREVEYLCRKLRATSMKIVEDDSKRNKTSFENSESDPNGEHDMREIDEAFDFRGDKNVISTDRFGSHDEDHDDLSESDAFEDFYESGEESDLEVLSDGEDLPETKTAESLSIDSLKVAFEALSGNSSRNSDSAPFEGKTDEETNFGSGNKKMGTKNSCSNPGPMRVLPLYAMLPASSQLRVFEEVKEGERLVIVATNVAETSLTIPGIKYVVDTGREKVKNYNSSNGIETYEVEWISKASAAQRAGRAGRTGPGHCYRLYSSAVFCNIFDDFSSAEISKVPVDGVVLLMKSMNIDKVANFPFPTPPEASALAEAERCLRVLEALDANSKLTPLGKAMAKYPMSPRHSRMLLTVIQLTTKQSKPDPQKNLVLGFAVAAAAALSLSNPFVMQSQTDEKLAVLDNEEKSRKKKLKEKAKTARAKFSNPTSDALSVSYALQCFELSENPAEFCNENCLHLKTMEEMSKLRKQLLRLVFNQNFSDLESEFSWIHGTIEEVESAWGVVSSDKNPLSLKDEGILREAIYAGWADRVAKRVRFSGAKEGEKKVNAVRYQACMVKETVFLHRWSSLSNSAPEYLVYNELLHTNRPYIHGATSVEPTWLVKYAESLCTLSNPLEDRKPYYDPSSDQVYCWVAPTFGPHLWNLPLHNSPVKGNLHRVAVFACALLEGQVLPCLRSYQKFMAASPASIVRPEATGNKRAGNLLNAMNSKTGFIDSCEKLRKAWNENRHFLYSEILEWFQEGFRDRFDEVWSEMHREVLLDHRERFSKRNKREKRRNF